MRSTGLSELAPGYLKFSISALSKWRAKGCDKYLKVFTERVNSAGGIVHSSNVSCLPWDTFPNTRAPSHPLLLHWNSTVFLLSLDRGLKGPGAAGTLLSPPVLFSGSPRLAPYAESYSPGPITWASLAPPYTQYHISF